jgi:hypothetical protein
MNADLLPGQAESVRISMQDIDDQAALGVNHPHLAIGGVLPGGEGFFA